MLISHLLKHATPEHAVQLYAIDPNGKFADGKIHRVTTQVELDEFIKANQDKTQYFNVALMAKADKGRGGEENARLLPWLYVDIDTSDGKHHGDRPTKAQVAEMLKSGKVVQIPSIVINSGGGLHAYWLLDTPLTDMAEAARLQLNVNEHIANWMKENGFKYEKLKDLARVLRVPGSINHKYGKPVVQNLPRGDDQPAVYRASQFPAFEKKCENSPTPEFDTVETKAASVALAACAKIPAEWGEDGSGYLLRLCRQCVRAGLSAKTAINVVRMVISTHEDYPTKWSDDEIIARFEDAKTQSTPGEGIKQTLPTNEFELSKYLAEKAEKRYFYIEKWKTWVSWKGNKFDQVGLLPLQEHIYDNTVALMGERDDKQWVAFLSRYHTKKGLDDMEKLLRHRLGISHEVFDQDPTKFFCKSGAIQFAKDGSYTVLPHDCSQLNLKLSKVPVVPGAKCKRWLEFIEQICVTDKGEFDPELSIYLQMLSGYCLTGRTDLQHLWILHGDGQNGKGAYVRTMQALMGDYAISIDQETFTGQQSWGTIKLFGARAAFASETDMDCRLNEHRVKNLTGGDRIAARDLYQSYSEFNPTHKLFLSTNYVPQIRGTDNGIWRRVRLIPFNAVIPIADVEMEPQFMAELPGILNWALEGYAMLQMYGFKCPKIVSDAGSEHREANDVVKQFVESDCELDTSGSVSRLEISQRFAYYCKAHGYNFPISPTRFNAGLKRLGAKEHKSHGERFWTGIRVKSEFAENVQS